MLVPLACVDNVLVFKWTFFCKLGTFLSFKCPNEQTNTNRQTHTSLYTLVNCAKRWRKRFSQFSGIRLLSGCCRWCCWCYCYCLRFFAQPGLNRNRLKRSLSRNFMAGQKSATVDTWRYPLQSAEILQVEETLFFCASWAQEITRPSQTQWAYAIIYDMLLTAGIVFVPDKELSLSAACWCWAKGFARPWICRCF